MAHPAAYLRKSKDAVTKGEHLAALMALVHADGHNGDTTVYDDWARSGGRSGLGTRSAWRQLCDDIESGRVNAVYMNDLDRGGRDLEEWLRFMRVAQERGVKVVDRTGDWSQQERRTEFVFKAWLAEEEYRRAKERSAFTKRMQQKRGDRFGHAPYGQRKEREPGTRRVVFVPNPDEPLDPLLDAVRETGGNVAAACKLLNAREVRTRSGRPWSPRTLTRIVRSAEPRLVARTRARPRTDKNGTLRPPAVLSRLVVCHCGQVMTPSVTRGELYCLVGHKVGAAQHGRYVARERHVREALMAAVASRRTKIVHVPMTRVETKDVAGQRTKLEEHLRRLGRAYAAGAMDDDEFDGQSAELKAKLAQQAEDEDAEWVAGEDYGKVTGLVDWDDDTTLGDHLRRLIRSVTLGADMRPTSVEWRGSPTAT